METRCPWLCLRVDIDGSHAATCRHCGTAVAWLKMKRFMKQPNRNCHTRGCDAAVLGDRPCLDGTPSRQAFKATYDAVKRQAHRACVGTLSQKKVRAPMMWLAEPCRQCARKWCSGVASWSLTQDKRTYKLWACYRACKAVLGVLARCVGSCNVRVRMGTS